MQRHGWIVSHNACLITNHYGSLCVNPESPFYKEMIEYQTKKYECLLWREDARVLQENSQNVIERASVINANCLALIDALQAHPKGK